VSQGALLGPYARVGASLVRPGIRARNVHGLALWPLGGHGLPSARITTVSVAPPTAPRSCPGRGGCGPTGWRAASAEPSVKAVGCTVCLAGMTSS
jgi:hypothetical protein